MTLTTRTRSLAAAAVAVLALGGLAACGSDSDSDSSGSTGSTAITTADVSGELTVTDVWARESAASTGNGAVYFTIENGTSTDDELTDVSVASTVAAMAQIHETVMATNTSMAGGANSGGTMGGEQMMTMQEVASVPVPSGGTVRFEPGGYHVMLMDLAAPLQAGQTFEVTLTFTEAGTKTVTATVRAS